MNNYNKDSTYETYTWAGVTRIRTTTLLETQNYVANGWSVHKKTDLDVEEDVDIETEPNAQFGQAQFNEEDLKKYFLLDFPKQQQHEEEATTSSSSSSSSTRNINDNKNNNNAEIIEGFRRFDNQIKHQQQQHGENYHHHHYYSYDDDAPISPNTNETLGCEEEEEEEEKNFSSSSSSSMTTTNNNPNLMHDDDDNNNSKTINKINKNNSETIHHPDANVLMNQEHAMTNAPAQYNLGLDALKAKLRALEHAQSQQSLKCLICLDPYTDPCVSTICWHVHCQICWLQTLAAKRLCPQCQKIVAPADLRRIYL